MIRRFNLINYQQIVNERTVIADLLKGNIKMHYTYDEYQFDNFILRSIDRKEIPISVLLNGGNKLVYKFSAINCSSCIQFGLSMIQQITHKITKEQLIIIAGSSNRREIQVLVSSLKLDYPVCLVE